MKNHFCLMCGAKLNSRPLDNRVREVCPACGWVYYEQVKVGAGALVENEGQLLLVQRAIEPWKHCWYLPAGYVEADEEPRKAAERETLEETGLEVLAGELKDVIFFDDDPRGNGIFIVYTCKLLGGSLKTSTESLGSRFFAWQDLPAHIAGYAHNLVINRWKEEQKNH
jgi:ADP-ribose pyrophosphatase YjhB (NUDIX family)